MVTAARKYATECNYRIGEKDELGVQLPQGPVEMLVYIAATGRNPLIKRQAEYAVKLGLDLPAGLSTILVNGKPVEYSGFVPLEFSKDCAVAAMPFLWPKLRSMEIKDEREGSTGPAVPELVKSPRFRALAEEIETELAATAAEDISNEN